MAKYDVDRFETPPDEDLICCICQCVLDNPLESPCRHVFCKVCIETWLTNRNNCPNCRKRLRVSKLKPVLPIVRNMINRLLIICENRDHGCTNGIKLEMYDKHAQNCDYAPIKCLNTGCGETVLRKNMLTHEQSCKFRLIMCKKGCGLPISMELAKKHNCLDELKRSMTAMEEQYKQRLLDLESKLNTKIQVLEDRIKAMEENCHQDDYTPGWGSARDSYSSLAGFDESDSPSRELDFTTIRDDYEDDNNDDDSNSFYYSGNEEDNGFDSTPEYQEAQADELTYDVYTPRDPSSEGRQQGDDVDVEDVEEEGADDDQRDSDSAFFLNSDDAENSNDSDGDLNDSLLDSSDEDLDPNDGDGSEPVQVYEVSPTSPHTDYSSQNQQEVQREAQPEGPSYYDVVQVVNDNSMPSSTHRGRDRRERQQTQPNREARPPSSSYGSRDGHDSHVEGSTGNEHSSLCSLHVGYGSSGRSSPRGTEQDNPSDQDGEAVVVEENRHTPLNGSPNVFQMDHNNSSDLGGSQPQGGSDGGRRGHSGSSERRRRSRRRTHTESGHHRTSGRSRRRSSRHSRPSDKTSQNRERSSQSSSQQVASSTENTRHRTEADQNVERTGDYLYGVPVDESDSSGDPLWERTSHDRSTDVSISDDYLSYESDPDASSPERYEKFLTSLHRVSSSESDKTWAPGDPDQEGWETEVDYEEDNDYNQADEVHSVQDGASDDQDDPDAEHRDRQERRESQHESGHESLRSTHSGRSSSRSPRGSGDRSRSRITELQASETVSRSSDSEAVAASRKRSRDESSSESDNGEDGQPHPAWKRRR